MTLAATALAAEPVQFESGDTPAHLIELFTSEGCSSCPPAEAWLSRLKTSPDLWKRVVPVAFHVDYWNSLGWADRFSTPANSARQRRYAEAWRGDSVYTPGFVLDGREWRDWFSHPLLPEPSTARVGKLTVTVRDKTAAVVFLPASGEVKSLQVELALLGGDLVSDVKRGENSGRKLRHDFTVLHYFSAPLRAEGGRFSVEIPLAAREIDAPVALAAWVTPGEAQPPIQATGGWLNEGPR
jgi:hypothetical protein